MADCDALKATTDLRTMRKYNLLTLFGKGKGTYYRAGDLVSTEGDIVSTEPGAVSTEPPTVSTEVKEIDAVESQTVPLIDEGLSTEVQGINRKALIEELPFRVQGKVSAMKERESLEIMQELILEVCKVRPFKLAELASILKKGDNYLSRKFLKQLIDIEKLDFYMLI